jgi:23S rRNA (uracil1939-C5)-methyltransferase
VRNRHTVDIYDVAYGGLGVGKLEGKVCLVDGALPGETVSFIETSSRKRLIFGHTDEVLKPSPNRVVPRCPYYGICGGCQYQHIDYKKEMEIKSRQARELMFRIGGIRDFEYKDITPSKPHYMYRRSITLHRSESCIGFFSRDKKTVIDISRCLLATESINNYIPRLIDLNLKKDTTIRADLSDRIYISNQPGNRFYEDTFFKDKITFSPLAFVQANPGIACSIVEFLRESIAGQGRGGMLYDLFCGIGFFGILLRDNFDQVLGMDNSSIAIDCAVQTKKNLNAKNIKFYCQDVSANFQICYENTHKKNNTIILDPPRSGLEKKLSLFLSDIKTAETIYYISCDPATLARDVKIITQNNNWRLKQLNCFDMFPRTKHIESVAIFTRE